MKPNFDYLERHLTGIIDDKLTGHLNAHDGIYSWAPSVNMNPEEQNFFSIEEAYSKDFEKNKPGFRRIEEGYKDIEFSLQEIEVELRKILLEISKVYLHHYFDSAREISRESYNTLLKRGLEAILDHTAIGTPYDRIMRYPTTSFTEEEKSQLFNLFNKRDALLNKGLDLLEKQKFFIYSYHTSQGNEPIPDKTDVKAKLTRKRIFEKANHLKDRGLHVDEMHQEIINWLIGDMGFTEDEIKHRFNISLADPNSFNKAVNRFMSTYR